MLGKLKDVFFGSSVSKNTKIIHLIIVSTLTILVYLNIFQNTFIFDDRIVFFNWPEIKNMDISALFKGVYTRGFQEKRVYRPLKGIIHAIDYNVSGNNTNFYHFQAVLTQILIVILVYLIVESISKKSSLAFLTSLIFAIHPVHTEAVTFMTASFDTIGILFFFFSFYFYIKLKNDLKKLKIYYSLSLIFAFLAFFTYELTLSLPLIIMLYDFCFIKETGKRFAKNMYIYASYFLVGVTFFLTKTFLSHPTEQNYYANSFFFTILLSLKSLLIYIKLLIFPLNLSIIQILPGGIESPFGWGNPETLDLIKRQSPFELSVLFAIVLIVVSLLIFVYFRKRNPIISFGIGWFFITLLPVSNIVPIPQILAARYEYLASFGAILLFSCALLNLYNSPKLSKVFKNSLFLVIVFVILLLSFRTIARNFDYKDNATLDKSFIQQNTGLYSENYLSYRLGVYYFFNRDYGNAIYYLNKLLSSRYRNKFEFKDANYYLTFSYIRLNKFDLARNAYNKLVKERPDYDPVSLKSLENILNSKNLTNLNNKKTQAGNSYQTKQNFYFSFPKEWNAEESSAEILVTNPLNNFSVRMTYSVLVGEMTIKDFINNQKVKSFGTLKRGGKAKIPSVDYAYIKIWDDNSTDRAQFFLFKGKNVLEVMASPFNSENINNLNLILNSIKFTN